MSTGPQDELLNSWKEIALYLNRGVRTVQRWESELGLPVRRPRGKERSAVVAIPGELDTWVRAAQRRAVNGHARTLDNLSRLHQSHERLVQQTTSLLKNMENLQRGL